MKFKNAVHKSTLTGNVNDIELYVITIFFYLSIAPYKYLLEDML